MLNISRPILVVRNLKNSVCKRTTLKQKKPKKRTLLFLYSHGNSDLLKRVSIIYFIIITGAKIILKHLKNALRGNNMAMIIQTIKGVVTNKFDIGQSALKFGRTADNQVQIDDLAVSNDHAQITCETNTMGKASYFLEDLGSTNGSFINEEPVTKKQLHHKDTIRIGWNSFTFIDEDELDMEKTTKIKKSWIPGFYYSK